MTDAEYRAEALRYRKLVEAGLESIRLGAAHVHPELLKAMFYSVDVGGKRIRPCLLLAVCEALGGKAGDALPFACSLEMIHTYSLIHDDLPAIDNDDMRRGKPSNHRVFGEGMAVFAGCGLLSLAFENMINACIASPDEGRLLAMREIAVRSGAGGMLSGQAADILNEGNTTADPGLLRYIHEHKTADMLTAAVIAGAHIAHADVETLGSLNEYSKQLGLLFQITDDILDVTGDTGLMGKTLGKDEAEGKLTYVRLLGLEGAWRAAAEAAEKAAAAVEGMADNGYLTAAVRSILSRSN